MVQFEQLFIAGDSAAGPGNLGILSHSPGVGSAVGQEVLNHCRIWAGGHPGGLSHPVVLSSALKAVMPSIKGPLFVVIRVTPTYPVAFHALILSKRDFRTFSYNPFAVIAGEVFVDALPGGQRLSRGTMEPPSAADLFSPAPNPADVGLVDEALQLFLLKGKLILNLDQPGPEADRVLGLIIHFLPLNLKEKLTFASYSGAGDPRYTLAAAFASGNTFDSWQRLFMTMENQGVPEATRRYVAEVRNALVTGDPQGVNTGEVLQAGRNKSPAAAPRSMASVPVGVGQGATGGGSPPARPPHQPPATVSGPAAVATPATTIGLARPVPGRTTGGGSVQPASASPTRRRSGRSRLIRQALPTRGGPVHGQPRLLGVFTLVVVLLAAGWLYLERSGKGREWGLFDLMRPDGQQVVTNQTPSLLEVVDVGSHYRRQLARIQRKRLLPGSGDDRQLRSAQAELLAQAAGPLLQQVELFLDLARDGIQQGHRPDREQDRLRALADQGVVLEAELSRLELAYFAFGEGVLWSDLDRLSDSEVFSRRDSLGRAQPATLAAVTREVGSDAYRGALGSAQENVAGMAALLELFAAGEWSPAWEKELKLAAEKVSPTASAMSRAYRNNAFTLVRLKRAERSEVALQAAFVADWTTDFWLSPGVRDVLQDLRHKSALFGRDPIPPLLQGVLGLYARLEKPEELAADLTRSRQVWNDLQANSGRRFDPAVYRSHLDRARYQAVALLVASGKTEADIPAHLLGDWDWPALQLFLAQEGKNENDVDWPQLAAAGGETFLGSWAEQRARRVESRLEDLRWTVDQAWAASRPLEEQLRQRVEAGQDWTSVWVDLARENRRILGKAPTVFAGDPVRSQQRNHTLDLNAAMAESRPLTLNSVVVRLDQEVLAQASGLVIELETTAGGPVYRSAPVKMGPAAPAGTGWVGTGTWELTLPVSPLDGFQVRALVDGLDEPVLEVVYPSLGERVGPGAFARPRRGSTGSLLLRMDDSWWRSLQVPEGISPAF